MVQQLKPEIRARILDAARTVFAAYGYKDAKMAQIADEAGLSAGNLYRYFKGKSALFEAVVPPSFEHTFDELLQARVRALGTLDRDGGMTTAQTRASELLAFWIEHRLEVVILLDRAQGSRYGEYGERFVERLVDMTHDHLRDRLGADPPEVVRFTLRNIFHTSRRSVVSILETYEDPTDIERAFEAFWSFQLTGLAGFEEWVRA